MQLFITWMCNLSTFETETDLRINITSVFKPNSELRIWHGEEHMASWRVFEDHMTGESTYGGPTFIFDNNRTTKYISQTHTSNKRKIEMTFHEPIYFEKLVILKPHVGTSPAGDSLDSKKFWSTFKSTKLYQPWNLVVIIFLVQIHWIHERLKFKKICLFLDDVQGPCTTQNYGFDFDENIDHITWHLPKIGVKKRIGLKSSTQFWNFS